MNLKVGTSATLRSTSLIAVLYSAVLGYKDGATKSLHLKTINRTFAKNSGRPFLPLESDPPNHPLKKAHEAAQRLKQVISKFHSVKAYADDYPQTKKPIKMLCLVPKTNVQTLALRSTQISVSHMSLMVRKCVTKPL